MLIVPPTFRFFSIPTPPSTTRAPVSLSTDSVTSPILTATPFANILIPHDNYNPKFSDDLYPKNFDDSNIESKITAIVKIISQGKNFIRDYYYSNIKAVEHNYNLIMSSKVEKLIQSSALDFINQ